MKFEIWYDKIVEYTNNKMTWPIVSDAILVLLLRHTIL